MRVRNFFCHWNEQLPLCVSPKTEPDRIKFVDLIKRTAFYHALDDSYLQKELSKIKESDQSLLKFQEEAINAEARRNHHRDVTEKSNILDATSELSVSKCDYYNQKGRNYRRGGR